MVWGFFFFFEILSDFQTFWKIRLGSLNFVVEMFNWCFWMFPFYLFQEALSVAKEQVESGAQILDIVIMLYFNLRTFLLKMSWKSMEKGTEKRGFLIKEYGWRDVGWCHCHDSIFEPDFFGTWRFQGNIVIISFHGLAFGILDHFIRSELLSCKLLSRFLKIFSLLGLCWNSFKLIMLW